MPGIRKLRIIYCPREDATPQAEVTALEAVYSFVLRCAQEKKRAGVGPARDDRKESNEPATPAIVPE